MRLLLPTLISICLFFSNQMLGHDYSKAQLNLLNDNLNVFVANNEYKQGIRFCNNQLSNYTHPTLTRFLLINKARLFIKAKTNIDSVPFLHQQQKSFLHQDDSLGLYLSARSLEILGYYYYYTGAKKRCVSFLYQADSAYALSTSLNSRVYNLNMIASILSLSGDYAESLMAYLVAEELVDLYSNEIETQTAIDLFIDMAMVYFNLTEYDKAESYYKRLENYETSLAQKADISNNHGMLCLATSNYEEALIKLKASMKLYEALGNKSDLSKTYNNIAQAFYAINYSSDSVKYYAVKSMQLKRELLDWSGLANTYTGLLGYYYKNDDFTNLSATLDELTHLKAYFKMQDWQSYYLYRSFLCSYKKDYEAALANYRIYSAYTDSVNSNQNLSKAQQTQTTFLLNKKLSELELAKKEVELANARATQRKSSIVLILAISSSVLLILITILYTYAKRTRTTKRELNRKLRYEAVKNIVDGQEAERLRIAKELHDGVGSQLALLKSEISKPTNQLDSRYLREVVAQTANDIRNISHDLMPYAIEKLGFEAAIEDLASRWKRNKADLFFDINVCVEGINLSNKNALTIFRIIQELVRNAIIHGNATFILINFFVKNDNIELAIEDNGAGMDETIWTKGKAWGMENIKNRVAYLNGQIKLNTSTSGTSYLITIPKNS